MRYDIKIRRKVFETFLKMEDTMDKKVHEIYCNSCGKKIETTDNIKREDYLSIKMGILLKKRRGNTQYFSV